jgi:hypothetical protein
MSSFVRTQHDRLWNLLIMAPTKSYPEKRKCYDSLFKANLSQCQSTGSSQPTYSTRPTSRTPPATLRSKQRLP